MNCATCGHEEIEHEEDMHHDMAIEAVPACEECIWEIDGEGPEDFDPAMHVWASPMDD